MNAKEPKGYGRLTRHHFLWCALPLLVAWAGCQQDAKVNGGSPVAGTYSLASVNGNTVPCALQHEGVALSVKSGAFIIHPEGICSSKVVFYGPSGGESIREVKATYTCQGSKLTMKWEGAGTTTGTFEGDTFTMNNEGLIFVYRK